MEHTHKKYVSKRKPQHNRLISEVESSLYDMTNEELERIHQMSYAVLSARYDTQKENEHESV